MGKLHHKALDAAVAKYSVLFTDGMAEDELKLILKADEKKWSDEEINEIVAAINPTSQPTKKDKKVEDKREVQYIVTTEFRDRNDFNKIHKVNDDFISTDAELIGSLIERNLIEKAKK